LRGSLFPPTATTTDRGHGRVERRTVWLTDKLEGHVDFPHVIGAYRLERHVTALDGSEPRTEVVHGVTSRLVPTGKRAVAKEGRAILDLARGHWTIENGLHHVRDMAFDEDRSQVRKKNGPRVMASLRNLAISVLRLAGAESVKKALRWCARDVRRVLRLVGLE
jgi:hypothetical protein